MKKLLIMVGAMALAMSASAGSITWGSEAMSFGSTSLKNSSTTEAYLVYLGNDADWNDPYSLSASTVATDFGTVVTTVTGLPKSGKATGTINPGPYENADTFALVFKYTDSESGKVYWNLTSNVNAFAGAWDPADPTTTPEDWKTFTANMDVKGEAETISAGDGWVTFKQDIPEPTTYALIGVAAAALALRKRFMKK